MTVEESWKQIPGFEQYEISSLGKIRKTFYICHSTSKGSYPKIQLFAGTRKENLEKGGAKYGQPFFVHRLVAQMFIPNPDNKPYVNHKDGNKMNCYW